MIKFHASIPAALKHPSVWAGISGAIASVAANLTGHMQTVLLSAGGLCSVVAIILKSPDTVDKAPDDNKEPDA